MYSSVYPELFRTLSNQLLGISRQGRIRMNLITCKYCGGTGKVEEPFNLMEGKKPCPTCGGAGEFVLEGPLEKTTSCKFCGGTGKVAINFFLGPQPCDSCKGIGLIERPSIVVSGKSNTVITPATPRPAKKEYDVAISFAGEDRKIASEYASKLKSNGVSVFYDSFENVNLWGKDLYEKLDDIYRKQAKYCVMFISRHYSEKLWTNHERKSAQARAFKENKEYILPVKLDDTELPGIRETVGYLDLREMTVDELVTITRRKIRDNA